MNRFPNPIPAGLLLGLTVCALPGSTLQVSAKSESYHWSIRVSWLSAFKEHPDVNEVWIYRKGVEPSQHAAGPLERMAQSYVGCPQCKPLWCVSLSHRALILPHFLFLGWCEGWKGKPFQLLYPMRKFSSRQLPPGCNFLLLPASCGPGYLGPERLAMTNAMHFQKHYKAPCICFPLRFLESSFCGNRGTIGVSLIADILPVPFHPSLK